MPKKSVKKAAKTVVAPKKKVVKKTGRGGAREGAGRPVGTGKYGAPTKAVRVPVHLIDKIMAFVEKTIAAEKKGKK